MSRTSLGRVETLRDGGHGLAAEGGVLAVPAVAEDAVDGLVLADNEVALAAVHTLEAVAAVPAATDAGAVLPLRDAGAGRDDLADDLVAWDAREVVAHDAVLGDLVTKRRSSMSDAPMNCEG
jgi:hypothetical protein